MADCFEQSWGAAGVRGIDACDCTVASGSGERGRDGMVDLLAIRGIEDRAENRRPERSSDHNPETFIRPDGKEKVTGSGATRPT
jgi:hypothetical protein